MSRIVNDWFWERTLICVNTTGADRKRLLESWDAFTFSCCLWLHLRHPKLSIWFVILPVSYSSQSRLLHSCLCTIEVKNCVWCVSLRRCVHLLTSECLVCLWSTWTNWTRSERTKYGSPWTPHISPCSTIILWGQVRVSYDWDFRFVGRSRWDELTCETSRSGWGKTSPYFPFSSCSVP